MRATELTWSLVFKTMMLNFRVRLFSVTVRTMFSGTPPDTLASISSVTLTDDPLSQKDARLLRLRYVRRHARPGRVESNRPIETLRSDGRRWRPVRCTS